MDRPESTIEFERRLQLEIECQRVCGGDDFGIENGRGGIERRVWQFGRIWLSVSVELNVDPHGRSQGGSAGRETDQFLGAVDVPSALARTLGCKFVSGCGFLCVAPLVFCIRFGANGLHGR